MSHSYINWLVRMGEGGSALTRFIKRHIVAVILVGPLTAFSFGFYKKCYVPWVNKHAEETQEVNPAQPRWSSHGESLGDILGICYATFVVFWCQFFIFRLNVPKCKQFFLKIASQIALSKHSAGSEHSWLPLYHVELNLVVVVCPLQRLAHSESQF